MNILINPSLMCMNFLDIKNQIEIMNKRVDMYHFDIMDGHYVPNLTLSPDIAKAIAPICEKPIDFHLMVTNPYDYVETCANAVKNLTERGITSYFSPHAEVINGYGFRIIDKIKSCGFKPGVVINPETPLCMIEAYMNRLDKITFLSVDPGFAGQAFIPEVLDKIKLAKKMKEDNPNKYKFIIEIDGSCNKNTFAKLAKAGIESFIVGSSGLFNNDTNLVKAYDIMLDQIAQAVKCNSEG